jgi:hypothetical protein
VDRNGETALGRRLEDGEVARIAVGTLGAADEEDGDEALVLGGAADLGGRGRRILGGVEDRRARASAAARYGLGMSETRMASSAFRTPASIPAGSSSSRRTASTSEPGGRPSCTRSCRNQELGCDHEYPGSP